MSTPTHSIYDFELEGLNGNPVHFSNFKGKKILIVNTASACMYTPQYAQLQELHEEFANSVVVVGCPCNDFGSQEPGTNEEVAGFCQTHYGVNFPMTQKIHIKGNQKHPLYQWLCQQNDGKEVEWNFQKFLVDENGNFVRAFSPAIEPLSTAILELL